MGASDRQVKRALPVADGRRGGGRRGEGAGHGRTGADTVDMFASSSEACRPGPRGVNGTRAGHFISGPRWPQTEHQYTTIRPMGSSRKPRKIPCFLRVFRISRILDRQVIYSTYGLIPAGRKPAASRQDGRAGRRGGEGANGPGPPPPAATAAPRNREEIKGGVGEKDFSPHSRPARCRPYRAGCCRSAATTTLMEGRSTTPRPWRRAMRARVRVSGSCRLQPDRPGRDGRSPPSWRLEAQQGVRRPFR